MTPDGSQYNKNIQRFARPLGAVMVILGLTVLAVGTLLRSSAYGSLSVKETSLSLIHHFNVWTVYLQASYDSFVCKQPLFSGRTHRHAV